MHAAGRAAWDASDWDIAAETTARLRQAAYQSGGLDEAASDTALGMMAASAQRQGQGQGQR